MVIRRTRLRNGYVAALYVQNYVSLVEAWHKILMCESCCSHFVWGRHDNIIAIIWTKTDPIHWRIYGVRGRLVNIFISIQLIQFSSIQWRRAWVFSVICAWINSWVNNREAGYLRRHRAHYDVILMDWDLVVCYYNDNYTSGPLFTKNTPSYGYRDSNNTASSWWIKATELNNLIVTI